MLIYIHFKMKKISTTKNSHIKLYREITKYVDITYLIKMYRRLTVIFALALHYHAINQTLRKLITLS